MVLIFTVVNQYYEAEVVSEYVIRGNTAVLKCNIPSFVADFVRVETWVGSDNKEYTYADDYGTCLVVRHSLTLFTFPIRSLQKDIQLWCICSILT